MQGVCILLLMRNKQMPQKGLYLLDLWGKRSEKLKILPQIDLTQLPKLAITSFNQAFRSTKWGANRFIDDLSFFSANKQETAMLEGDFWGDFWGDLLDRYFYLYFFASKYIIKLSNILLSTKIQ
jgi:hypothetical protein